jgi:endonuclease/exonuclease/phosphatase family metal-dependent hydrolase
MIVNHWPSRKGGVLAGEDLRLQIASMIKAKTDSISGQSAEGEGIIMLGDFNCTPGDQEMKMLVSHNADNNTLINLSVKKAEEGLGTYRYMGAWEMIDQVLVSEKLLSGKKGLYTHNDLVTIFKPDFLIVKDPKYPGSSPFSTYRGYRYQGGFSDHLPVIVDLRLRSQAQPE